MSSLINFKEYAVLRWLDSRALAALIALAVGPAWSQDRDLDSLVIESINVIDVHSEQTIADQTLVIVDGQIVSLSDAEDSIRPIGSISIDGEGLYLMPGLVDAHVHLETADLELYLANGITTVVEMNGSVEMLAIRELVEKGELLGPRIYMASPLLAGTKQNFSFELVDTPVKARQAVQRSKELGYDFIKVYDGLSLESYESLVDSGIELNMPLLGHIPASVTLQRVLLDDFMSIEHVEQLAKSTVGQHFDKSKIPDIVAQLSANRSAVTPTLAVMEILGARNTAWFDTLFERDEMRYTPNSVANWWQSLRVSESDRDNLVKGGAGGNTAEISFYRKLTRELHEQGVFLLVGTDTPNPLLVPGFSIHHELAALVRAGISNGAVLRMATSNAAQHLNAESKFGKIERGMLAELILLRENPLKDIEALQAIEGLIMRNRYFDRAALDELLDRK